MHMSYRATGSDIKNSPMRQVQDFGKYSILFCGKIAESDLIQPNSDEGDLVYVTQRIAVSSRGERSVLCTLITWI